MKNKTLIEGTKGSILINSPWLPNKKSLVEVKTNKRYYKSFVNTTKSIFANQIHVASKLIIDGKKEGEWKFYFEDGKLEESSNFVNDKEEIND